MAKNVKIGPKYSNFYFITTFGFFGILAFTQGLLIRVRQFWSDFDAFGPTGDMNYDTVILELKSTNLTTDT